MATNYALAEKVDYLRVEENPEYLGSKEQVESPTKTLAVYREFKPFVNKALEKEYGLGYKQALGEAREYFKEQLPQKTKVTKVEGNVVYVDFAPYGDKIQTPNKLREELDRQKQKFGSLVNVPTNEDDDLERITEIIM